MHDGTITAFEIDDLTGIGPYSVYPRTSGIEGNQVVNLTGGPYRCPNYRARAARGVPEQERDVPVPRRRPSDRGRGDRRPGRSRGRRSSAWTRVEFRRRNLIADDAYPSHVAVGHQVREALAPRSRSTSCSTHDGLRRPARRAGAAARARHPPRHRLRRFIELTNPSAAFYGVGGARISAQDGCTLRLDADRRGRSATRRHRAGPGHRSHDRADASRRRSACRSSRCASSPATPTSRPMAAAPGPRAAPASAARRRCRPARRCAQNVLEVAGVDAAGRARDARHPERHRGRRGNGPERLPLAELAASPTSAPTRCRRTSSPS